jgi:hypothetical protein
VSVNLGDPGDVPATVRERVTKSVAYTAHHPLPTGGLRVVARRVAGVNGVAWHVRYDDGTDPRTRTSKRSLRNWSPSAAAPMRP